ncbi:flagellar protein FlbD [Salsuginibacillus halophilus]|uniref:Flagellar protein FlbD n=1 Tax=Salsuginibacillus halophilus TaxID=517424 RepID=A0A2P8HYB7_9BACI|nr:flagellar FlbD family protein [Salsuginibacillus halophilus]PSL51197.1 flagellar protein FlbD [Salsuginibacillus halophilus]
MIELTRLNGARFLVNVMLIEQAQANPDTTITLTNGRTVFVKESLNELKEAVNSCYHSYGLVGLAGQALREEEK